MFCLSACTADELDLPTEVQSEQLLVTRALGSDTLKRDSIVLFQVDPDTLPPRRKARASTNYVPYLSDNLYAIRNMDIYISTQEKNPNYLTCNGAGQAVVPGYKKSHDNDDQKFFIEVLPATAGIPYVIRTSIGSYPLAVGQYSTNPEHKLLYASSTTSATLPAASWDIYASSTPGYLTIESQALLEMGSSGNWQDYYYCVWEHRGAPNEIVFSKYEQKDSQEFVFTPVDLFEIEEIKFFNNYGSSVTRKDDEIIENTYINTGYAKKDIDLPFEKDLIENYSFNEFRGVNFAYSNLSTLFKRPSVKQGVLDVLPDEETSIGITYDDKNIVNHLSAKVPVTIPARTQLDLVYHVHVYEVTAYYEATIKCSYNGEDRRTKVSGFWEGTIYVDELAYTDHDYTYTHLDTGVISKNPIFP